MSTRDEARITIEKMLRQQISISEFEAWLYMNESLQVLLNPKTYLELISFNYKNPDYRSRSVWSNLHEILCQARDELLPFEQAKDLTNLFLEARQQANEWTTEHFKQLLKQIQNTLPQIKLDFDYDSGENWASIFNENHLIAFIHRDMPLAIIMETLNEPITLLCAQNRLVILQASQLEDVYYALDSKVIPTIFPDATWSGYINPRCFSLGDLLYTTLT